MIGCFIEAWPQTLSKEGQTKNIKLRIRIININCLNNINNIDSGIVRKRASTSHSGTRL